MANPPKSASEQWELAQQVKAGDIKTSRERDSLEDQRPAPMPQRHLTPEGEVRTDPDAERREARIAEINAALQKAQAGLQKDFDHSRG